MTPQSVESLMADIEAEDPLDIGDLAIDEQDARRLMANHFCEIDSRLASHGLDTEARLEIMAAIAAHTMVENMLLQVATLRDRSSREDFRGWMKRHGLG
jgi:hypothetical protein